MHYIPSAVLPLPCRAVLENHHAALAFKLTLQHKKFNIFKNLDKYVGACTCVHVPILDGACS